MVGNRLVCSFASVEYSVCKLHRLRTKGKLTAHCGYLVTSVGLIVASAACAADVADAMADEAAEPSAGSEA